MKRTVLIGVGVPFMVVALLLAACATSDGGGAQGPAAPSVSEPASPSSTPTGIGPSRDAAWTRRECIEAVWRWLRFGGTGTADNYDAERAVDAPSADAINARFGWGTVLDEARGYSSEGPQDPVGVCQHSFPPPADCEFPLGEVWVNKRAEAGLPVVEPDLYAEQVAALRLPESHAGEPASMYVYVPSDDCPDTFTGQVLLGVEDDGQIGEELGGHWYLYPKSQLVRFVVDGRVDEMCSSPDSNLESLLVRVEATVLDEPSPTFRVESMKFIVNYVDERLGLPPLSRFEAEPTLTAPAGTRP